MAPLDCSKGKSTFVHWRCASHVVFAGKYATKTVFEKIFPHLAEVENSVLKYIEGTESSILFEVGIQSVNLMLQFGNLAQSKVNLEATNNE